MTNQSMEGSRLIRGSGLDYFRVAAIHAHAAYRLSQVPFAKKQLRQTQVVARMQQYFIGPVTANSVLPVNTTIFEFGVNYHFMDSLRAMSSYGRQFAPQGNGNVWTLALTYRLVTPLGRGAVQ